MWGWIVFLREHEDPLRMGELEAGEEEQDTGASLGVSSALLSHLVRTKEF